MLSCCEWKNTFPQMTLIFSYMYVFIAVLDIQKIVHDAKLINYNIKWCLFTNGIKI